MIYINEELKNKFNTKESKKTNRSKIRIVSHQNSRAIVPKKVNKKLRIIVVSIIAAILISIFLGSTVFRDDVTVLFYSGSEEIKQISNQTGMNSHGKAIFYSTQPELVDYPTLKKNCLFAESDVNIIEYGCYLEDSNKIYLLNIKDSRLAPMMAVTAGHEMLHKVFSMTPDDEKNGIIPNLSAENIKKTNFLTPTEESRLSEMIKPYESEGLTADELTNEMHSLVGTEITLANSQLLSHYDEYFTDQSIPVEEYNKKESAIALIEQEINDGINKLSLLEQAINDGDANLSSVQNALNYDEYIGDIRTYNINVGIYNKNLGIVNGKIDEYNSLLATLKTKMADYDAIITNIKLPQQINTIQ
jgi:hypothetical protein